MRFLESFGLVAVMLCLGSLNTMVLKLMFQTECSTLPTETDIRGESSLDQHQIFNKPWLSNLGMFSGEALLLLVFHVKNRACRPIGSLGRPRPTCPSGVPAYIFAVPACCDVLGTGIAAVGMTLIDAAAWQMMRGSIVVFSALLTVFFLRRQLEMYHWLGVAITTCGLTCIGAATILEDKGSPDQERSVEGGAALGIMLVILAQVFSAFQCVFEEHLLCGYEVSSMQTVGMEGVWGVALMAALLATLSTVPGSDHGVAESLPDGLYMVRNTSQLQILIVLNMLLVTNYNYVGMQVCRKLSAVTRCLVDSMRTVVVWALQLALYYGYSHRYGHPWTDYSWLQVCGFLFLTLGTLVYNGVVKLPGQAYDKRDDPSKAVVQAVCSPRMNRASLWSYGQKLGLLSPHSAHSPQQSPLSAPFGFSLTSESDDHEDTYIVMEEEEK